jgi:SWI/SNF-related matrix-associated actin-dependent regulator of chromatin subfamily A-like protein 1
VHDNTHIYCPLDAPAAVQSFKSGKTDVCIISLRSAAGIDGFQERGKVVVFAALDWSPAIHSQGEDRLHRDGQKDSVLAYYLVTDEGTDPDMLEALGLKVSQFVGIMSDKMECETDRVLSGQVAQNLMQRVVEKLRAKAKSPGAPVEDFAVDEIAA